MKQAFRFICWLPKYWFGGFLYKVERFHWTLRHLISQEPFLGVVLFWGFSIVVTLLGCLMSAGAYRVITGVNLPIEELFNDIIWWYAPVSVIYFLFIIFQNLYDRFLEDQNRVFNELKK